MDLGDSPCVEYLLPRCCIQYRMHMAASSSNHQEQGPGGLVGDCSSVKNKFQSQYTAEELEDQWMWPRHLMMRKSPLRQLQLTHCGINHNEGIFFTMWGCFYCILESAVAIYSLLPLDEESTLCLFPFQELITRNRRSQMNVLHLPECWVQ